MKIRLSDIFIGEFPITQYFGKNPEMYAKYGYKGHNGVDWRTPLGTQILAGHDGEVVRVEDDKSGYGIHVRLWNKEGKYATIYAHFQKAVVIVGEKLVAGQLLGLADSTGYSTGHHLHFSYCRTDDNGTRLNQDNGYGGWCNPLDGRSVEWDIKNLTEPVKPPSNGKGTYTEEEMTKMRLERDNNWNLYTAEKTRREGLKTQVKNLNDRIGNLERQWGELINSLANQLQCESDESAIKGKIEELLGFEDRLNESERRLGDSQKAITSYDIQLEKTKEDLTNKTLQYGICSIELKSCENASNELEKRILEHIITIDKQKNKIEILKQQQPINNYTSFQLIEEIIGRIFKR